jgi:hypothetical protein
MTGDLWTMPGGHKAIEVDGSTRDTLRLRVIQQDQWLQNAVTCARSLCTPAEMRYFQRQPRVSTDARSGG